MKKLILIRHAKSSWEHDVVDHERPLSTRGFKDAKLVSNQLKTIGLRPDLIVSSHANRAKETAKIVVQSLEIGQNSIHLDPELYDFSGNNLLKFIKNCNQNIGELMIFGHNHALTAFVNTYGDVYIDNVPTSGAVILVFDIDAWSDLKQGRTVKTVFPRNFR